MQEVTMETVLVGLDPPLTRGEPLRWAADYCRLGGAELVGVVAHHASPSESAPDWYQGELAGLRKQAEAALGAIRPAVPHRLELRHGEPAGVIAELAHEEVAAMVVVGTPGTEGFRGLGLGTHRLSTPLVIVPTPRPPLPGGPVVVGLDGSAGDAATLGWAVRLARATHGPVCAVYATEPVSPAHPHPDSAAVASGERAVRERVATLAASGADIATFIEVADPVTALTRVADQRDASVVVVGSGAGHSPGVVLGRVPGELPFQADRPVAIVPLRPFMMVAATVSVRRYREAT
jgi:nucleotide-binding universal stress UspA family protein